ncbi:MAG: hypothetical protein L6R42_006352 [Xanthoria sp. 1 TBL-2021]|nr:MAG: hypothetical protein L6R42_006352 [Xanthoria sp. 1 TBL-2021]
MPPGVHSLPVQFDNLNLRPTMSPPNPHQPPHPPPMPGLGNLGPEFDTSLLRKEKDVYEGYHFEKVVPQQPNEKATWALVTKTKMPIGQNELRAMVDKQKRKGPSAAWNLLKSDEMKGFKRKQVDELIGDRMAADPRFDHDLVGLKLDQHTDRRGSRTTTAFQVILKRQLRKDLSSAGPAGLGKLHESHREVIDLTGGSQDPSEGSSQDYLGGSSPDHHFMPPPQHGPQHGFPGFHGFENPPPQPPFVHHQGPPMHEMHQGFHHESPPLHHPPHHMPHHQPHHPPHPMPHHMPHHEMPHFEDPFVHPDQHRAHPPPAPFPPHVAQTMPHHEGHKEKLKQAKDAKPKGAKEMKPEIHQEKPYKSETKHRKAHSESDWDYLSESSDSSRAYTDRTPDTSYSHGSSRKDYKRHERKDSRRSSHSHHDDHGSDRHEQTYRVHRRKPVVSPDRSRQSGRSRYEADEIEVIPASNMRIPRPYLTRSRTSAHRPDRLVDHFERPAFHSRHMSYDDDRPHDFRGLTPPGRRAPIYAPKRPMALDLYDHREEQERAERDEMRRELMREERRKEELRESVARQMEREAEDVRRRERMTMDRDMMYDERPGRWARNYDNDRYRY